MKEEEPRQRRKEGRMKNGERSKHKAKSKGKHKDSRLGSREAENVPLVSQQKQPAEGKGPMAKLQDESAIAIGLQVLLPYLLAGLGMVLAGMVLDYVQPPYAAIDGVPHLTGFEDTASLHCSWSSSLGTAKD